MLFLCLSRLPRPVARLAFFFPSAPPRFRPVAMSPATASTKASSAPTRAVPEIVATVSVAGDRIDIEPPAATAAAKAAKPASTGGSGKAKSKAKSKAKPKEVKPAEELEAAADELLLEAALPEGEDLGFPEVVAEKPEAKNARALASIKVGPKGIYTEDSIRVYLQEIGRIRLLRPDEEIELARKIADLLELEEKAAEFEADHGRLPHTPEWAEMFEMTPIKFRRRLMLGRRAKEKMVQSNLRLVVSIAKKYMNRGLSFQDLIQEGSLGLIRAAEKFDHEKGYKFSTYATWWIRQAITRAIADQSRTIRLPVHLYETIPASRKPQKL